MIPVYNVFFNMKNSYHQTATGPGGIIGGRYPVILDLCSRIKTERELNRVGLSAATVATQQAHRTELEDARVKSTPCTLPTPTSALPAAT
jgi:hypothetical protein